MYSQNLLYQLKTNRYYFNNGKITLSVYLFSVKNIYREKIDFAQNNDSIFSFRYIIYTQFYLVGCFKSLSMCVAKNDINSRVTLLLFNVCPCKCSGHNKSKILIVINRILFMALFKTKLYTFSILRVIMIYLSST